MPLRQPRITVSRSITRKGRREKRKAIQDPGPGPNQDLARVVIVTGPEIGENPGPGPGTEESLGQGPETETGRATSGIGPGPGPDPATDIATSTRRTRAGAAETTQRSSANSKRSPGNTRSTGSPGLEADPDPDEESVIFANVQ